MINIFHPGAQHRDEIRTSHVKLFPVAMSSAQNRQQNKPLFFKREQPSLCIVFHLQARIFRSVKFSNFMPTAKLTGKEVFTNRKCLVKLPKFMHDERDHFLIRGRIGTRWCGR